MDVRRVQIVSGKLKLTAILRSTATAELLWEALPLSGTVSRWGHEVFFETADAVAAVELEPDARQVVDAGALCYWCEGKIVALPYGPTPISLGDECRLVAPVNVWGQLAGDPSRLAEIGSNIEIRRLI